MTEHEQLILDTIKNAGKPIRPGDIATASGLDKDSVGKALKTLKKSGLVDSPKPCFYAFVEN